MSYKIADWSRLFPRSNGDIELNERNVKIVNELVAYYFSKPHMRPLDKNGNLPKVLQNFKSLPDYKTRSEMRAAVQNLAIQNMSPDSWNQFWSNWQSKFVGGADVYDNGYEAIFLTMPLDGYDFWEVQTVNFYVEFKEIPYGGDVIYHSGTDSKDVVFVKWYGAGVGIDWRALQARKFHKVEDELSILRNQAYAKKAQVYYGLIEAVNISQNIPWQNPIPPALPNTDPKYTAVRDALTINKAVETIIENCKNKGYSADLTKETFIILYDYRDEVRMRMAAQVTLDSFPGSPKFNSYRYMYIPTQNLNSNDYYYTILPQRKIQKGEILDLTQFTQFNQTNMTQEVADWLGFGGVILDIEQIQRCLKS